jgi:hypothetical protein
MKPHPPRKAMSFFIWAIANAGLRPFGQVIAQFMMVLAAVSQ